MTASATTIAYEQSAAVIVAAAALAPKNATLADGAKIPTRRIWMQNAPPAGPTLDSQIAALAAALPLPALRRAAGTPDSPVTLPTLAATLRPHLPPPASEDDRLLQLAALAVILKNPIHFHRRHPHIHAVDPTTAARAQVSFERRQQQNALEQDLLTQLEQNKLPPLIRAQMRDLLHAPDKTGPAYRALKRHAGGGEHAFARFFIAAGALKDERAHLIEEFRHHWGAPPPYLPPPPTSAAAPPPPAAAPAYAIDDRGTREIDDAFSAAPTADGGLCIGIHIAAPALLIDKATDRAARRRQVSAYFPCAKHFMLPPAAVTACSLATNTPRTALSLYITADAAGNRQTTATRIDRVTLAHTATPEQADAGDIPEAMQNAIRAILTAETALEAPSASGAGNIKIDIRAMTVTRRPRSGAARLIEILMRTANALWARELAAAGAACLYRQDGELKLTPPQDPTIAPYAWLTSPLRRYADLANQRVLLARLTGARPPRENWRKLRREFDRRHTLARRYQRALEIHWALRIVAQDPHRIRMGEYQRKKRVLLKDTPLVGTLPTAPPRMSEGDPIAVTIDRIDLLSQRLTLLPA